MPGYENAPATRMLATRCACCGRPLVDAKSVEIGIGPDCRAKYHYNLAVSETDRVEANRLVYLIAEHQTGLDVGEAVAKLRQLGFAALADRITTRIARIRVTTWADSHGREFLLVQAPYVEEATRAWKAVPGHWWYGDRKAHAVPVAQRTALWDLLQRYYSGLLGHGPKGFFRVPRIDRSR